MLVNHYLAFSHFGENYYPFSEVCSLWSVHSYQSYPLNHAVRKLLRVKLATKVHISLKSIPSLSRRFSEISPRTQLPQSDVDNSANSSVCPFTWRTTWHLAHEIDLTAQHYLSYFRLRGIFDKSLVMNLSESTALQRRNVSFLFLLIGGFIKPI